MFPILKLIGNFKIRICRAINSLCVGLPSTLKTIWGRGVLNSVRGQKSFPCFLSSVQPSPGDDSALIESHGPSPFRLLLSEWFPNHPSPFKYKSLISFPFLPSPIAWRCMSLHPDRPTKVQWWKLSWCPTQQNLWPKNWIYLRRESFSSWIISFCIK